MTAFPNQPDEGKERIVKPELDQLLQAIHERARRVYEASGAPFGSTETGLRIWLDFGQDTTSN